MARMKVIQKGERPGWIYKYYLLLQDELTGHTVYRKAHHHEYVMVNVGDYVSMARIQSGP